MRATKVQLFKLHRAAMQMATERIDETKLAGNAQDGQGRSHELGKGGKSKRVRRELDRPTIRSV